MENPWQVPSLDEYLFYCCPECDMKTKEYVKFYEHAVHRHEQAKILLVHDPDTKEDIIKAEEEVLECDFEDYNSDVVKVHERKKRRYWKRPPEEIENVQCYFCGFMSKDKKEIKSHIEQNHNGDVTKYMYGAPRDHQYLMR